MERTSRVVCTIELHRQKDAFTERRLGGETQVSIHVYILEHKVYVRTIDDKLVNVSSVQL
jgi:hypothetical protein